ncbi:hypothetical protein ACI65L_004435 [Pectobacterium carotovorum]
MTRCRFLSNGNWEPHKTVATLSNAMDVSPAEEQLAARGRAGNFRRKNWQLKTLGFGAGER